MYEHEAICEADQLNANTCRIAGRNESGGLMLCADRSGAETAEREAIRIFSKTQTKVKRRKDCISIIQPGEPAVRRTNFQLRLSLQTIHV